MPRRSTESDSSAVTGSETYHTLLARAQRRTGGVLPERIVRHVLSVTQDGDWPVRRDALDAVLRRCASTHADQIQIVGRPRGRLLGLYATRRRGSRARPYRTLLRRIEPLDGSCECADFLRNSLGLCKHLFAVLEDGVSKRRPLNVESLMSGLRVRRTASGGLLIEAPRETASTLAALFSGMAQLLRAGAARPLTPGDR